uniref:uncharacterized protein LOC120332557 n=1 Tax=Styela clava TaxID=7725 RepID=UPI001939DC6B|nr:uncharacterized protein LOC120332557 [Styela clava]
MKNSDSEAEGELLIDESEQTTKKTRRRRKQGPVAKISNAKKKSDLKLVVKTTPSQANSDESKTITDAEELKITATRTSTRIRNRVRRHSPSPISVKKEPPKKRLRVKIKNVRKSKKLPKITSSGDVEIKQEKLETGENVDIVNISDEELSDTQYPSIPEIKLRDTPKKYTKQASKTGIKLKLSLGKVLSSKVAECIVEEAVMKTIPHEPLELKENIIKPLIISKQRVSAEVVENSDQQDTNTSEHMDTVDNNHVAQSQYYSSSSENHKPLTLRLSVGKQKSVTKTNEIKDSGDSNPQVFPNIRRSWSTVASKGNDAVETNSNDLKQHPVKEDVSKKNEIESWMTGKPCNPPSNLPKKPFFSLGLQSLLDVVSVELNEQKKSSPGEGLTSKQFNPSSTSRQHGSHPASTGESEGHLPSLTFPKPALHFSTKKRQRSKSVVHVSNPQLTTEDLPKNILSEIEQPHKEEANEEEDCVLTEKERRRHDKKKNLDADFVDPDALMKDEEAEIPKIARKKHVSLAPRHINNTGGLSLLMPQMTSTHNESDKPKLLQTKGACHPPVRNIVRKPKKGMATAKQRLANKLKLGRTHAF